MFQEEEAIWVWFSLLQQQDGMDDCKIFWRMDQGIQPAILVRELACRIDTW